MSDNEERATLACLPEGTMLRGGMYRIVRFIGSGGFGCTYEAIQEGLEERVAVKEFFVENFCNRDGATGHITVGTESRRPLVEKMMRKFVGEAQTLSRMRHDGIVRVRDVFRENGTAYYVMDYIDGCSLADLISRRGRLDEAEALRYIRQVCGALAFVHDRNCLHLDIKPGNIMIGKDGKATLIDFGTAKQYDEANGENTTTLMGKTPGYAPPEQMSNSVGTFYKATDIYALGATLYKTLTGTTPPDAALLASGQKELAVLPAAVSPSARAAVAAAMQLSRKSRPQSITEFLSILDGSPKDEKTEIDTSEPTRDTTDPPASKPSKTTIKLQPQPAPRTPTKNRTAVVVAAAFILCVVGIYGISSALRKSGEPVAVDEDSLEAVNRTNTYAATGAINGHEYVDLGLSVKWATCNVGASSPEDYGDYYAWGETETKASYDEDNCETWEKKIGDIGGTSRDVARVKWGGPWRLPTLDEIRELEDNCDYEWTTLNGVKGVKYTSRKNGNSIFLPAAGWRRGTSLDGAGEYGDYWGSTPYEGDSQSAYGLDFVGGAHDWGWNLPLLRAFGPAGLRIKRSAFD